MFNSTFLDVAIGMIFIYLLLSIICTAANEIIELWLKKRATDLERGLRELLVPGSASGATDLVQRLYDHPLINGLFEGQYEDSGIAKFSRYFKGTSLPSYIPARNFALALMDIILPGQAAAAGAAGAALSGAAGATVGPAAGTAPITINVQPTPPGAQPAVAPPATPNALAALRAQIQALGNPQVERALIPLIDAAGNDVARVRENLENWFNSSMDRVSGWYKRRTQVFILIIGFFLAIAFNADSIIIAKKLASDRALRQSLVSAADAYAKANASASPSPSPTATPSPTPVPTPEQCWKNSDECKQGADSPACKLKESECRLEALGLPIGWPEDATGKRDWPGLHFWTPAFYSGWTFQFRLHFFGWLLTALAISLGAPFWFDLLNKFIVVRSTVKPKEKSPEEKPK